MRRISLSVSFLFLISIIFISKAESTDRNAQKALFCYIQAGIYEGLNQLDEAVGQYKLALKSDHSSSRIHLRLARALLKQNKLKQAANELELAIKYHEPSEELLSEDPSIIEAHTLLALIYSLEGDINKATVEYETALHGVLTIEPENIQIHKSLAQIYFRKRQFDEAQKTCEFILDVSPNDYQTYFLLGSILEGKGQRKAAIQAFNRTLEFNPDYHLALNSLGYLYAQESINLDKAEEMIKKALVIEPDNGAYIDSLGWVYYKQGRYEEALQELERAIQFLSDPVIYDHLGDAYFKEDDLIKARENWQKALEITSEDNLKIKEKLEKNK